MNKYGYLLIVALLTCGRLGAQIITTVAGIGDSAWFYGGDGLPATTVKIHTPSGVVCDKKGNIYFSEWKDFVIRKVDNEGVIRTFAGTNDSGFTGDGGPATNAKLSYTEWLTIDEIGNIYFTDPLNQRIRKVDTFGIITTYAGNGTHPITGWGGPATAAGIGNPDGIHYDTIHHDLYFNTAYYILKVDAAGIITRFAGNGVNDYDSTHSGDGGMADTARVANTAGIVTDTHGNLYFGNYHRIRKIDASGIITNFAGKYMGGDGPEGVIAADYKMNAIVGLYIDSCENMYVTEAGGARVRIINHEDGRIYTVAGNGIYGFGGDGGPAKDAKLDHPNSIFLGWDNGLYIADGYNYCIRKVAMPVCTDLNLEVMRFPKSIGPQLLLSPNPYQGGALTISVTTGSKGMVSIQIVDMLGSVAGNFEVLEGVAGTVYPRLAPGVYQVIAQTGAGRITSRLLVQ